MENKNILYKIENKKEMCNNCAVFCFCYKHNDYEFELIIMKELGQKCADGKVFTFIPVEQLKKRRF